MKRSMFIISLISSLSIQLCLMSIARASDNDVKIVSYGKEMWFYELQSVRVDSVKNACWHSVTNAGSYVFCNSSASFISDCLNKGSSLISDSANKLVLKIKMSGYYGTTGYFNVQSCNLARR